MVLEKPIIFLNPSPTAIKLGEGIFTSPPPVDLKKLDEEMGFKKKPFNNGEKDGKKFK